MKLIVPYAEDGLADEVRELGESLGAQFVLTPRAHTTSYSALMCRLWSEGEAFIVCEQDVLPTVAMLEEMWTCTDDEWCHGYWVDPNWIGSPPPRHSQWLGLARFSESLLQRVSNRMVGLTGHAHWNQQDIDLWYLLKSIRDDRGPHLHHPAVTHLHGTLEERRGAAGLPVTNADLYRARLGLTA